ILLFIFQYTICHHPRTVEYISRMGRNETDPSVPYVLKLLHFLMGPAGVRVITDKFFTNIIFNRWDILDTVTRYLNTATFFRFLNYVVIPRVTEYRDFNSRMNIETHVRSLIIQGNILTGVFVDLDDYEKNSDKLSHISLASHIPGIRNLIREYANPIEQAAQYSGIVFPSNAISNIDTEAKKLNYFYDNIHAYIFYLTRPNGVISIDELVRKGEIPTIDDLASLYGIDDYVSRDINGRRDT